METSPKVCMLIARFYPQLGGTELQALRLAKTFISHRIETFVLTQRYSKILKKKEIIEGVPVYRRFGPIPGFVGSIGFMFSSFLFLVSQRRKSDIIYVHLASSPAIVAGIVGRLLHKKTILKFGGARKTGDIYTSGKKPWGGVKLWILQKFIDYFVCPSEEVKKEIIAAGFPETRIIKIPNAVETNIFSPVTTDVKLQLRKKLSLPSDKKIIIYSGRLSEGKGVEILLAAFSRLLRIFPAIYLVILGEGKLRSKLIGLSEKENIVGDVLFGGYKENVNEYLQASDLFVNPSLGEGLSNSVLEAMAVGLAVVVTGLESNKEIIKDGVSGIIVEPDNVDSLIEGISDLLLNPEVCQTLGKNASEKIRKYFSLNIIADVYSRFFKEKFS